MIMHTRGSAFFSEGVGSIASRKHRFSRSILHQKSTLKIHADLSFLVSPICCVSRHLSGVSCAPFSNWHNFPEKNVGKYDFENYYEKRSSFSPESGLYPTILTKFEV